MSGQLKNKMLLPGFFLVVIKDRRNWDIKILKFKEKKKGIIISKKINCFGHYTTPNILDDSPLVEGMINLLQKDVGCNHDQHR